MSKNRETAKHAIQQQTDGPELRFGAYYNNEPQPCDQRWYYPLSASPLDPAAAYRYESPSDGVSTVVVLAGSTGWAAGMVSYGATTWDEIFDDCDRYGVAQ